MKTKEFTREDDRYLDFEDVTEGSIILVEKDHEHNKWSVSVSDYPYVKFEKGDIWVVEGLANRPRVAIIRNLQRNVRTGIRVDSLIEIDDKGIITIGPGPDRAPREDD